MSSLGFSAFFSQQLSPDLRPARVASVHGPQCEVVEEDDRRRMVDSGRHALVTGDWVALDADDRIARVLERRSTITRKRPDRSSAPQVLVANVDHVFIVAALGAELNERRIERFLTLVWDGGASPTIVLSKCDRVDDLDAALEGLERRFIGVPIFCVSATHDVGISELVASIAKGQTVALLGPSGVGKSTLLNRLAGREVELTSAVRDGDDKGRHTTTRRSLTCVDGYVVIDTPGLREIGLAGSDEGIRQTFDDIARAAEHCRFRDCQHAGEPGCAVDEGVADGTLDAERVAHYLDLMREHAAAEFRRDARAVKAEGKKVGKMIKEAVRWRRQRRGED